MIICSVCVWPMTQAVYVVVHLKMQFIFILECCLYNEAREELKLRLVFLHELTIEALLFSNATLTDMQNLQIFKFVLLYIIRTKRFTHLWSGTPPLPFLFFFNNFPLLSFHIQVYLKILILYNFMVFILSFSFFIGGI
jgi:hypothetical protein